LADDIVLEMHQSSQTRRPVRDEVVRVSVLRGLPAGRSAMFSFRMSAAAAIAALSTGVLAVPAQAFDKVILAGCVITVPLAEASEEPRHLVWSEDGAMLEDASVVLEGRESEPAPVLYWLDDQEELKAHVGRRVELTGTIDEDFEPGKIELEEEDGFVEITVSVGNEDAKARIPRWMFRRHDVDDLRLQVLVRKVDVERVTLVSGKPCRQ
jgi:hypothetical protein